MGDGPRTFAFEAWVEEARAVDLRAYARQHGAVLHRQGSEWVGACPGCGGRDRFAISTLKGVWHCRKAGRGGDAIELAQHVEARDFREACRILTGRDAPDREATETAADRDERLAALQARRAVVAAEAHRRRCEADGHRLAEIKRARRFWEAAGPIAGTPAEAYLRLRGVDAPPGAHLRFAPAHTLYAAGATGTPPVALHTGPALLAGLTGPDDRFCGVHATWIDLTRADGKAVVADPETGAVQPAKKVRGAVHGARIELARAAEARTLILGEGIETCLSVYQALRAKDYPLWREAAVWSAVSLGNLAGRALDRVRHPTRQRPDGRAEWVRGPTPDPDWAALQIPDAVDLVVLLGDGDSDRFDTGMALARAKTRLARPGRQVGIAWAEPGRDFNDMLRSAA